MITVGLGRDQAQNSASRQCDALSYELSWGGWSCGQIPCRIVGKYCLGSGVGIAAHRDVIGNLQAPRELMRGAIRDYLNPLTLDSLTVSDPNTLAVAIAAMRIAGVRVRLLHRPVGIEDIHMIGKRRVGIPNEPRPYNAIRNVAASRRTNASAQSD